MKFLENFGIKIKDLSLLETALTHSSYSYEHPKTCNYERLEFLGDSVLQLIMTEFLYKKTSLKEGDMTKKRSGYVCEHALSTYAKTLGIPALIKVGEGQKQNINDTIIADVFEAIIGCLFIDQGYLVVSKFVLDIVTPYYEKGILFNDDYKTLLQEYVQTGKRSIQYEVVRESGKQHEKQFEVVVKIDDIIYGRGIGGSKKEAEKKAAFDAYQKSAK